MALRHCTIILGKSWRSFLSPHGGISVYCWAYGKKESVPRFFAGRVSCLLPPPPPTLPVNPEHLHIPALLHTRRRKPKREGSREPLLLCQFRGGGWSRKEDNNKNVGFFQYIPSKVGPDVLPNLHIKTHNYYMVKPHRGSRYILYIF